VNAGDAAPALRGLPGYDDACLWQALPFAERVASGEIVFRAEDEGFVVDEAPSYLPSGTGEHLYLHIEKRGMSTPAFLRALTERFALHERDVGYAGRKDARGITRQWVSVPARIVEPRLSEVSELGVRLLESARHGNKLRLGHLRGNHFTITLKGDVKGVEERSALIARGVPNLFGSQRFGPNNDSLRQAENFVAKNRRAKSRRDEFLISVIQSSLFNAWLADRISDHTWHTPLDGDVMLKAQTGAPFVCTDAAIDRARCEKGEIVVGGPLVGRAMRPAEREAMTRESRCWAKLGVNVEELVSHPSFDIGARRAACIFPTDLQVTRANDGVSLGFFLPKGSYESVVLRAWIGPELRDAAFVDGGAD
jgi:tRNA pseudouridine13 synthase